MKTKILNKKEKRIRRHKRVRAKIFGTSDCPRLAVFKSNLHIYAQVIDDEKGITLTSASSLEKEIRDKKLSGKEKAKLVGELIAKRCLEKGIKRVVFDRGGFLYHGRVKILAESARENGLKF